jgi:hypothetical protein
MTFHSPKDIAQQMNCSIAILKKIGAVSQTILPVNLIGEETRVNCI